VREVSRPGRAQVQKRLGPEWPNSGTPAFGSFTRKTAQAALQAILTDARRDASEASTRNGVTVADAAAEWLRHAEFERDVKPSTLREYRSIVSAHLLPAFGEQPVETLTTREIELWRSRLIEEGKLSRRTINKVLTALGGVMGRAQRLWDLPSNPVTAVERRPDRYSGELQVLSPRRCWLSAELPTRPRMRPSSSWQGSPACGAARSWR
jgi:integrase